MVPTNSKTSQSDLRARLQKVIAGVTKYYSKTSSLLLGGTAYTPSDVQKLCQSYLDAMDAADALAIARHNSVVAVKGQSATARPVLQALMTLVASQYGSSSATLAEFGFVPRKSGKASAITKAGSVQKAAATRLLVGPTGTKQRKAKASAPKPTAQASTTSNGSHPLG